MAVLHFRSRSNETVAVCQVRRGLALTSNAQEVTCKACLKDIQRSYPDLLVRAMRTADLVAGLYAAFKMYEDKNCIVRAIWLNPINVRTLWNEPDVFARECDMEQGKKMFELFRATLMGYFFGAMVFESNIVPTNHVAVLPDGFAGHLVDKAACMPLRAFGVE